LKVLLITGVLIFAHFLAFGQKIASKNILLNGKPITVTVEKHDLSFEVNLTFLSPKIHISIKNDTTIYCNSQLDTCITGKSYDKVLINPEEMEPLIKYLSDISKSVFSSKNYKPDSQKIYFNSFHFFDFTNDSLKFKINNIDSSITEKVQVVENGLEIVKNSKGFFVLKGKYGSKQLQELSDTDKTLLFTTIVELMNESASPLTEKEKELMNKIDKLEASINQRDTAGVFTFKPTFEGNNAYYRIRSNRYFKRLEEKEVNTNALEKINTVKSHFDSVVTAVVNEINNNKSNFDKNVKNAKDTTILKMESLKLKESIIALATKVPMEAEITIDSIGKIAKMAPFRTEYANNSIIDISKRVQSIDEYLKEVINRIDSLNQNNSPRKASITLELNSKLEKSKTSTALSENSKRESRKSRNFTLKTANFNIDSLEIKIEDQSIQQILLFANNISNSDDTIMYLFKNRRSIPIRSVPHLVKYPRTRMIGFSYSDAQKDKSFHSLNSRDLLKQIGYEVPVGSILNFVPSLQNYTYNISPQDTIIHVNPQNLSNNTFVFRSNVQDYLRINLFTDALTLIGREENPVFNTEVNLRIPMATNYFPISNGSSISYLNFMGGNLTYSQFSNDFDGLQIRNKNTVDPTGNILQDSIKAVSTIDLYRYAFLKSAMIINAITYKLDNISTEIYLNIFSEFGSTKISDSIFSDTVANVRTVNTTSRNYNFMNFGTEIGFRTTPLTNFRYQGFLRFFHPFLTDINLKQDYGTTFTDPSSEFIVPINGINDLGNLLRKSLFTTGVTLSYYPNREKLNLFYFRFQYTGYLHNWGINSYPILQFGYSISLSKFISTLKK